MMTKYHLTELIPIVDEDEKRVILSHIECLDRVEKLEKVLKVIADELKTGYWNPENVKQALAELEEAK